MREWVLDVCEAAGGLYLGAVVDGWIVVSIYKDPAEAVLARIPDGMTALDLGRKFTRETTELRTVSLRQVPVQ